MKKNNKNTLIAPGIFLALAIVQFAPYLFSGEMLLARDQLQGYGLWAYFEQQLRSGIFPLWSDISLAGMPSFDGLPGDAFYPPFLLSLFLFSPDHVHGVLFFSHTFLAGVLAYKFLRHRFSLAYWPSIVLAVFYELNTNFISHVHPGHTGKFYVLAWLPFGLSMLFGLLDTGKVRHMLGLSFFLGICLFTSHVQLTYFVLIGFFAITVGETWIQIRIEKILPKIMMRKIGLFSLAITLGLGLGAPILYPAMKYTSTVSARADAYHTSFEHATSWSSHPEEVASLLVPEYVGYLDKYWGRNQLKFNSEYSGLGILLLGVLGLVLFRKGRYWLFAVVALLSVIYSLGANTPLFQLFFEFVPGVKKFRAPSIMFFWFSTALFILSAYFVKDLDSLKDTGEKTVRMSKRIMISAGIVAGMGLLSALISGSIYEMWNGIFDGATHSIRFRPPYGNRDSFLQLQQGNASNLSMGFIRLGIFAGAILLAISFYLKQKVSKTVLILVIGIFGTLDLLIANWRFIQTQDAKKIFPEISLYRELARKDTSFYRVFDIPGAFPGQTGFHGVYGLRNVSGFYDNELRWYREFHGGSQDYSRYVKGLQLKSAPGLAGGEYVPGKVEGNEFLNMLTVKYVLAKDNMGRPVYLQNEQVLPHGYWVPNVKILPEAAALEHLQSEAFNPRREAIVLNEDRREVREQYGIDSLPLVPAKVKYGNTRIEASIRVPRNGGLFVLSEIYYPGWKARVNGKEQKILRVNYALRGLALSSGENQIVFEFSSPNLKAGWSAFGASAILLLVLFGFRRKFNY